MFRKVLVTGAGGQLAMCLKDIADRENGTSPEFIFLKSSDLDIRDFEAVSQCVERIRPDLVINCAAYTAVDKAEEDIRTAYAVNFRGAENLADACRMHNAVLVHISTDYVFDGTGNRPYREDDPVSPVNVYGDSKAKGERAIINSDCKYLIIRTSWLYSEYRSNFFLTMLRLMKENRQLKVVNDQYGAPTYAGDLAAFLFGYAKGYISHCNAGTEENHGEILHFSNSGYTTWHGFASEIASLCKSGMPITPCTSEEYPVKAKRPKWSVFDKGKLETQYGVRPDDWKTSLAKCFCRLQQTADEAETHDYFIHPTSVEDKGCRIGKGTKIWHFSHIMAGATIGENCNIGQNVVISPEVTLGNNVKVQNNVSVYTGVTCGDDVFLGPSCVFTNVINPRSAVCRKSSYMKTNIGRGASIGANATIVCGHDIGEYAFIGAGAVVTRDVPPYALVIGNPARQCGWISEYGHRLDFDADGNAVCPESGEKYRLDNGQVHKIR